MRWPRLRPIQIVALAGSLVAAGCVLAVFGQLTAAAGRLGAEPQVIATVDLRLGNTLLAAEQGEAQARADLDAGKLQLQAFEPAEPPPPDELARQRRWKQRYGVIWTTKAGQRTPFAEASMAAYNRVMRAEIERRHGRRVADELLPPAPPAETRP